MTRPKRKDISPTGALEENQLPDGRRKIKLRAAERKELLRQQLIERAVVLFLDLETDHTWAEIARELGLSASQLRDLTKTPEFDATYNLLHAELGHDPRFRAAQGAIVDMLPTAIRELRRLLLGPQTPAGVKMKAIDRILLLNGLQEPQTQGSDRQELATFLVEHRIKLEGMVVPQEYQQAFQAAMSDVVDSTFVEVPALPETLDAE